MVNNIELSELTMEELQKKLILTKLKKRTKELIIQTRSLKRLIARRLFETSNSEGKNG